MWLSFIALPTVVLRLATTPRVAWPQSLLLVSGALLLFVVLAGYEFVSVAELRLPALSSGQLALFRGPAMYYNLRAGWAGFFRPVSGDGSHLIADLQLSLPLWACVCMGMLAWRRRGWGLRVLLVATFFLFILLLPISALAGRIWSLTPVWVDQITDQWPMQRFYPILSVFAPFAGLLALGSVRHDSAGRQRAVVLTLALGCLWCGFEAGKFLRRGFRVALPEEISRRLILEENATYAIYSVGMLGDSPRSFSSLPLAAEMQLRMLDPTCREVRQSNLQDVLEGGSGARQLPVPHFVALDGGQAAELQSPLLLPPGGNSLVTLNFDGAPPAGALAVTGKDVWKEFRLPEAAASWPAVRGAPWGSTVAFAVAAAGGERLDVRFTPSDAPGHFENLVHLNAVSYDPERLPLHIVEHIPLRIRKRGAEEGWLETPRIFIGGYRAQVDGKPAGVGRSPDGLVIVRVPAGGSMVELDYPGDWLLRASFWTSFAGWLLLPAAFLIWHCSRKAKEVDAPPAREAGRRDHTVLELA